MLLLFAAPAMAAHPFAPWFGIWTGTGSDGQTESNLTVTAKQAGKLVMGTFNGRPKQMGSKSYSGTFRGTLQADGCYAVNAAVMGQPQNFEATACLKEDKSIEVTSMLANGVITPFNKFTACTFEFTSLISKATGTLYKKGGAAKPKKKKRAPRRTAQE